MKFSEINKAFTAKVAEWMAKGYHINTATMEGHQGEIGKIDLTDGKEIIRINLASGSEIVHEGKNGVVRSYWLDYVELTVGRDTCKIEPDGDWSMRTLWTNDLAVVETCRWYVIGKTRRGKWYGTKDDAIACKDKAIRRRCARRMNDDSAELGDAAKKAVLSYVRRQKGCATCKLADIKVFRENGRYKVKARGKSFTLR